MSQQGIVSFHFLFTEIEPSFVNASFVLTEKQVNQPCWLSTHDGENHQLRSSTWFPIRKLRTCDTQRCEKSTMMCMETSACMCIYIYMCVCVSTVIHVCIQIHISHVYTLYIYIYVHRTKKWYVFPLWIPNTDPARCCKTRPSWAKVATENFYSIPKSKKISPLQVATASPFHVWSWFFSSINWVIFCPTCASDACVIRSGMRKVGRSPIQRKVSSMSWWGQGNEHAWNGGFRPKKTRLEDIKNLWYIPDVFWKMNLYPWWEVVCKTESCQKLTKEMLLCHQNTTRKIRRLCWDVPRCTEILGKWCDLHDQVIWPGELRYNIYLSIYWLIYYLYCIYIYIYLYVLYIWLVDSTPLKNMKVGCSSAEHLAWCQQRNGP